MDYALIRADINADDYRADVISEHKTEEDARTAMDAYRGTTKDIGLYVARRLLSGDWETRLEAHERLERVPAAAPKRRGPPAKDPAEVLVPLATRFTVGQKAKIARNGGQPWLRRLVDEAPDAPLDLACR